MSTASREVEVGGELFAVTEPGHYALAEFLEFAATGADSETLEGFHRITGFIEACLDPDPGEVARFRAAARRERATGEHLVTVVMEALAARPTSRPSVSSGGPATTATSSSGDSSSRVIERLEEQGRPDLAAVVHLRREALSA